MAAQKTPGAAQGIPQPDDPLETLAETIQQLIDDLPEQIALIDERCAIVAVNTAWRAAIRDHGYPELAAGCNYREFCLRHAARGYEPAIAALAGLEEILSGQRDVWEYRYNGRDLWSGREYHICLHRLRVGSRSFISVTRQDMTEILRLRRLQQDYSASFLEGQAAERQRMSRELHDSTSQLLTGIGLLLGTLKRDVPDGRASEVFVEMQELLTEIHREIRSISYLAFPPPLEKMGLPDALKSLVEGFARRTALDPSFEIVGIPLAISRDAESALYRIAQEALSNIHRHARATQFSVVLSYRRRSLHLAVSDDGLGIPPKVVSGFGSAGVGLVGMRARLREIGGRLTVRNSSEGATIVGSVPAKAERDTFRPG